MGQVNVFDVLNKVYGPRGIPFPRPPMQGDGTATASGFIYESAPLENNQKGTPIRKYTDESLGQYVFMPVSITWYNKEKKQTYNLPNPLIIITGEKEIIETDLVDVGTVFEKVFMKPYDISVICTIIGENGNWPEDEMNLVSKMWKEGDLVTLKSALTDIFLQPENNFIIKRISVLDSEGAESVEVIQIDGRSNIDFELIIK